MFKKTFILACWVLVSFSCAISSENIEIKEIIIKELKTGISKNTPYPSYEALLHFRKALDLCNEVSIDPTYKNKASNLLNNTFERLVIDSQKLLEHIRLFAVSRDFSSTSYKELQRIGYFNSLDDVKNFLSNPDNYTSIFLQKIFQSGLEAEEQNNYLKAAYYFAKCGESQALYNVGFIYEEGHIDGNPNDEQAECYYKKADTADAYNQLGNIQKKKKNYEQAELFFEIAFNKYKISPLYHNPAFIKRFREIQSVAALNLGILYKEGHVGRKSDGEIDYEKAKNWLEKSEHNRALLFLGEFYQYGYLNDGAINYEKAKEYYLTAIKNGYVDAAHKLGYLYLDKKIYDEEYPKLAVYYLEMALNSTQKDFQKASYHNLGVLSANQGAYEKAKDCYEKSGTPESLYNIGLMYEKGLISNIEGNKTPTYDKALEYYQKSSEPFAKVAQLGLYQLGYLHLPDADYEEVIQNIINSLNKELDLIISPKKRLFILGVSEYYLRNTGTAFILLTQALLLDDGANDLFQSDELIALIKEIEEILEQRENNKQENIAYENNLISESSKDFDSNKKEIETNKNMKIAKLKRLKKQEIDILKARRSKEKFLQSNVIQDFNNNILKKEIRYLFYNEQCKIKFNDLKENNKKFQELLNDISYKPWTLLGSGKPEILRNYNNQKGWYSRRINGEDRLVYKVTKPQEILIMECEGHYNN